MNNEFLTLFEATKALLSYIDTDNVFDKAAAGGCSGIDYHLSDKFYDLIVDTRKAINNVENGIDVSSADNEMRNGYRKLFETAKALVAHIVKEPAFDKVNDMGPVGIETYQSNNFIEIIQHTENTLKTVESELL